MFMEKIMYVIKRDGRKEELDLSKFHKMVAEACDGLAGVSESQVEVNSGIQFYDGITTKEIQKILVRSATDLISLDHPNYQYVAARLLLFGLYKEVYGQFEPKPLREMIKANIEAGVYDSELLEYYTDQEWAELEAYIKYERDYDFVHAGLQQMVDKYLVQDRVTGKIYETPQEAFMLVAAVGFHKYPAETRLRYVKAFYDATSKHKISLPTPIVSGVRTPVRQYASCVLIDVGDSLDSIFASNSAVGRYTANRAGIGLNFGRIRAIKSPIRNGEVEHTGIVPFLKVFEATTKSCQQGGLRGGGGTTFLPIWHKEIESYIVLKNNKGTEDNRVRKLDYTVQLSKLFYERFLADQEISLFSPHEVPGLYEAFGLPEFDALYAKYEKSIKTAPRVRMQELLINIMIERAETGRVYIMNIDHANNGPFYEKIYQSNLCVAGDTLVDVQIDGVEQKVDIASVNNLFHEGKDISVKSQNLGNGEVEYRKITNSAQTSPKAQVMRITDEATGKTIVVTPDHKVFTKNRGYVEARKLTAFDELVIN